MIVVDLFVYMSVKNRVESVQRASEKAVFIFINSIQYVSLRQNLHFLLLTSDRFPFSLLSVGVSVFFSRFWTGNVVRCYSSERF